MKHMHLLLDKLPSPSLRHVGVGMMFSVFFMPLIAFAVTTPATQAVETAPQPSINAPTTGGGDIKPETAKPEDKKKETEEEKKLKERCMAAEKAKISGEDMKRPLTDEEEKACKKLNEVPLKGIEKVEEKEAKDDKDASKGVIKTPAPPAFHNTGKEIRLGGLADGEGADFDTLKTPAVQKADDNTDKPAVTNAVLKEPRAPEPKVEAKAPNRVKPVEEVPAAASTATSKVSAPTASIPPSDYSRIQALSGLKAQQKQTLALLRNTYDEAINPNSSFGAFLQSKGIKIDDSTLALAVKKACLESSCGLNTRSVTKWGRVDQGSFNHFSPGEIARINRTYGTKFTPTGVMRDLKQQAQLSLIQTNDLLRRADAKVAALGLNYKQLGISRHQMAYALNTIGPETSVQTAVRVWNRPQAGRHDFVFNWRRNISDYNVFAEAVTGQALSGTDLLWAQNYIPQSAGVSFNLTNQRGKFAPSLNGFVRTNAGTYNYSMGPNFSTPTFGGSTRATAATMPTGGAPGAAKPPVVTVAGQVPAAAVKPTVGVPDAKPTEVVVQSAVDVKNMIPNTPIPAVPVKPTCSNTGSAYDMLMRAQSGECVVSVGGGV